MLDLRERQWARQYGLVNPLVEVAAFVFEDAFAHARESRPLIKEATSEFVRTAGCRYFLTEDHFSGFAIRWGGELVYLHSRVHGRGDRLVSTAIALGARRLDCFDGYLVDLYGRHGFVEYAREANWTPGGPDVVFMEHP
jgi:hypothetical protein